MEPYRGFLHRPLSKRQGLGGVLDQGLVPDDLTSSAPGQATTTAAASQNAANSSGLGGVIGGLTSLAGQVSSVFQPSSAGSSITSASSAETTASRLSTTSTTSAAPTPTPTSTPSVAEIVYTSSDGTSVVYLTSTLSTPSATNGSRRSFLQNPSLEGGIFALVAIVVLIIAFTAITWTLRKRRRDRLERDLAAAVTFDPGVMEHYEPQEEDIIEKRQVSRTSSGRGHGHSRGYGYGMQPAYTPHQDYGGPVGYGQYPTAAYNLPPPNPAPYPAPPSTIPQPARGGANLTRKFSDRKPVPPLFPDYDLSNAHVSTPPRAYQQ